DVVNNFADNIAYETYSLAYAKTQSLQTAVNAFVASPDSTKFEAVRTAYTEARRIYLQSEAFRF
ncbi:MAG: imelysin, partial [Leptospira sp.]|nr:imelysin [Leptospira sp.]